MRRRRRIRKLRLLALLTVLLIVGSVSFSFGLIRAVAAEIDAGKLDPQKQLDNQANGYIYDKDGKRILAVLRGSEARTLIRYDQIADPMRHAIVAIEDRRFWEHDGVDLRGIGRALVADIRHQGVVEGGSTITQQFVKNALDRDQKTIARKVREAAYAWQLERDPGGWSKKKILQEYLNTIYFGNGAYGVQQAALAYFQHGAKDLTLAEAALLAGIPADPTRYDPVTNPAAARQRRAVVLKAMFEESMITEEQRERANATDLPDPDNVRLPGTEGPAQHFVNYVKQQLIDEYGQTKVFGGGLRVRTTIDLKLQQTARDAISKWLTQPNGPSAALVAIDPRDGAVRAMVGGNNYRKSQFNLAVQGVRQPGSSFKPFVLATALREGISPATHFESAPQSIDLGDKRLGRRQLRRHLLREHRPREGDDRVGQLRLCAADAAGRVEEGGRDGEADGDPEQARRVLRDRARRGGRDPARARPLLCDPRPRRQARGREDLRQQAAGDHGRDGGRAEAAQHAARHSMR